MSANKAGPNAAKNPMDKVFVRCLYLKSVGPILNLCVDNKNKEDRKENSFVYSKNEVIYSTDCCCVIFSLSPQHTEVINMINVNDKISVELP